MRARRDDTNSPTPAERVDHRLAAAEIRIEQGALPDCRLDELLDAIEARAWPGEPSTAGRRTPLSEGQLTRARSLAGRAIRLRGGRYHVGLYVWVADGARVWITLP